MKLEHVMDIGNGDILKVGGNLYKVVRGFATDNTTGDGLGRNRFGTDAEISVLNDDKGWEVVAGFDIPVTYDNDGDADYNWDGYVDALTEALEKIMQSSSSTCGALNQKEEE